MTTYNFPTTPLSGVQVQALEWLAGAWQGSFGEDSVDEYWSHAAPGSMVGVFRWVQAGVPWLYEMMLVEAEGEGVVARFKHFDPGLTGREAAEKNYSFDLVTLDGTRALFHMRDYDPDVWLFYERDGDVLTTFYQRNGADITGENERWRYRRQS